MTLAELSEGLAADVYGRFELTGCLAATDIIDLDFKPWHTEGDTMDTISADSLQTVGRVGLLTIEKYILGAK